MDNFVVNVFQKLDVDVILQELKQTSGATYDIHKHELVHDTTGYGVALSGYERDIPNFSMCRNMLLSHILIYLFGATSKRYYPVLSVLKDKPTLKLGLWLDSGNLYFDVTENIPDLQTALVEAANRKQKAIWDCANKQVIYI